MLGNEATCPIWIDEAPRPGTETYALFRRRVELAHRPIAADLGVFADSRYALWINGRLVGRGPARFDPRFPEYDLYENVGAFVPGANVLAVLVRHFGTDNFRWIPAEAGLWIDCRLRFADGRTQRVASDGAWKALPCEAFERGVSKMNVQLPANEEFDARRLPVGWTAPDFEDGGWPAARPVDDTTHGTLAVRSIPPLAASLRWSGGVVARGQLDCAFDVHDIRTPFDEDLGDRPSALVVSTFLHSPTDQATELVFGTAADHEHWLRGEPIVRFRRQRQPYPRRLAKVRLTAGWNSLVSRCRNLDRGHVELAVGVPRRAKVTVSGTQELDNSGTWWRLGPVHEPHHLAALVAEPTPGPMPEVPTGCRVNWQLVSAAHAASDGGLRLAWSRQKLDLDSELEQSGHVTLSARRRPRYAVFDMGELVLGRPTLDLEARAGTRLELAFADRLGPDGRLAPLKYGRIVDRTVCRRGEQRWQLFDARGARYLLVAASGGSATIRRVGMETHRYPADDVGRFACSDPLLERIWELGRRTLVACMEDAYTDCPTRERGQWLGDLRVEFLANLAVFGDHLLARRGLRQFAQSQTRDGRIAGVYPCRRRAEISDYILIWISSVYDIYRYTGDRLLVEELFPAVQHALGWFHRHLGPDGLLVDVQEKMWTLVDWADIDRRGETTALCAFYYEALRAAVEMARLVGDRQETVAAYRETAAGVRRALGRRLWLPRKKRFADCRTADGLSRSSTVHSNVLPLAFDMLPESRRRPALDYVKEQLADIFHDPPGRRAWAQRVSPYFMHYVLAGLYACDEDRFALDQIRSKFGWMVDREADTLWENFTPEGSLCHAWSACSNYYLSTKVLGVEFLHPGRTRRLTLWPRVADLDWARGIWPHPDGPVHVHWRRDERGLELEAHLPRPMDVEVRLPADLVDRRPMLAVDGEPFWQAGQTLKAVSYRPGDRWLSVHLGQTNYVKVGLSSF